MNFLFSPCPLLQILASGPRSTYCVGWSGLSRSSRWRVSISDHSTTWRVGKWWHWVETASWPLHRLSPAISCGSIWRSCRRVRKGVLEFYFIFNNFLNFLFPSECESSSDAISSGGAYDSNSRSDVSDYLSDQKLPNANNNNNNNNVGQFSGKYYPPHLNGEYKINCGLFVEVNWIIAVNLWLSTLIRFE